MLERYRIPFKQGGRMINKVAAIQIIHVGSLYIGHRISKTIDIDNLSFKGMLCCYGWCRQRNFHVISYRITKFRHIDTPRKPGSYRGKYISSVEGRAFLR